VEQHKSSGKRGEQSKQISDEPDWFYEKSDWDKTIDKWRNKVADKSVVENQTGVWVNDNKREEWMDDFKGKIYVEKPGWHWVGIKENAKGDNDRAPDMRVNLRPLDRESVEKYVGEVRILTKEQAKEMWSKPGSERVRNDKDIDNDIPF
jgi:hypothetical protein